MADGFLQRLKERKLVQWSLAYAAGAFALLQGLDIVAQQFAWPEGARRGITIALVVGFFIALVLAWYHGERGAQRVSGTELLIVALLLAIGGGVLWRFVRAPVAPVAAQAAAAPSAKATTASATSDVKSIAVLPFVDMSQAKDQEYFSDGLSEELLNQLAQIPQLRVIARTSSFSFKGKEVDVATIAKALDVANVLEGSVRKSGTQLRITAQLIRAADSSHLWSQTYDRSMDDVFKVQDEISREVVAALKLKLLPDQRIAGTQRTNNTAAYEQYLIGNDLIHAGGGRSALEASLTAVQRAIALDPDYANAWAALSNRQAGMADFAEDPARREAMIATALASADKAIALAPDLPDGYNARGYVRFRLRWDWQGAQDDLARASALDPNRADTLKGYSAVLFSLGRRDEGLAAAHKAVAADPLDDGAWTGLGRYAEAAGDIAEAKQAWTRALAISPQHPWVNFMFGNRLLKEGDVDGAIAHYQRTAEPWGSFGMVMAEFTRGNDAASSQLLAKLEKNSDIGFAYQVAQAHAWRGEKDQAFAWLDRGLALHDAGMARLSFDPAMDPLRKDPRFAALVAKLGFPK